MTYAIKAPARYAQGAGELANLGRSAKKLGNKFLVICTDNSRGRFGAQVEASLAEQEKEVVFTTFHGEATKDEVFAKMDECRAQGCDVVVGMGGGKALDTAKAVAENLGLPCVIIPTVASNDAPCSGVAVLYNDAGVVIKAVLMRRNPDLVLVDTGIIANAPRRLFAAGLGDALSTWFEARACKNSGARTMARGNVSNTGLMMARLCYDLLMEKGRDALAAVERHEVTPALEDSLLARVREAAALYSPETQLLLNPAEETLRGIFAEADVVVGTGDFTLEGMGAPLIPAVNETTSLSFPSYVRTVRRMCRRLEHGTERSSLLLGKMPFQSRHYPLYCNQSNLAAKEMWSRMWLNRKGDSV